MYYPFLHFTTVSHYVLHVHSVQRNAGMGNTDTLHPNSCFCSFSIPTSEIQMYFRIKFLLLVTITMAEGSKHNHHRHQLGKFWYTSTFRSVNACID